MLQIFGFRGLAQVTAQIYKISFLKIKLPSQTISNASEEWLTEFINLDGAMELLKATITYSPPITKMADAVSILAGFKSCLSFARHVKGRAAIVDLGLIEPIIYKLLTWRDPLVCSLQILP